MARIINSGKIAVLIITIFSVTGCEPLGLRLTVSELVNPPEWKLVQEITEGAAGDGLGYAVDISENYAIVGAPGDDGVTVTNQGAAYIYVKSGEEWQKQQKITSQNVTDNGLFGSTVAISDKYAVVTSAGNGGRFEIFERNGSSWTYAVNLPLTSTSLFFPVDIWEEYVIVGDYTVNKVKIFYKNDIWEETEISGADSGLSDGILNEQFGRSVAIYGEHAAVGADLLGTEPFLRSGKVFVYPRSPTWITPKELEPPMKVLDGKFGRAVALSDSQLLVAERGTAKTYFYDLHGADWVLSNTVEIESVAIGGNFGCSASLSDRIAIVGADGIDSGKGGAYIFENYNNNWLLKKKLIYPNAAIEDYFGAAVAVRGDYIIVGAYGDDNAIGNDAGTAYIFHRK